MSEVAPSPTRLHGLWRLGPGSPTYMRSLAQIMPPHPRIMWNEYGHCNIFIDCLCHDLQHMIFSTIIYDIYIYIYTIITMYHVFSHWITSPGNDYQHHQICFPLRKIINALIFLHTNCIIYLMIFMYA